MEYSMALLSSHYFFQGRSSGFLYGITGISCKPVVSPPEGLQTILLDPDHQGIPGAVEALLPDRPQANHGFSDKIC